MSSIIGFPARDLSERRIRGVRRQPGRSAGRRQTVKAGQQIGSLFPPVRLLFYHSRVPIIR